MLKIQQDDNFLQMRRYDFISLNFLSPEILGLAEKIREIVPYSDNVWLAQSMYIFYPHLFVLFHDLSKEPKVEFDIILPLQLNNDFIKKLEHREFYMAGSMKRKSKLPITIKQLLGFQYEKTKVLTNQNYNFSFASRESLEDFMEQTNDREMLDFPPSQRVNIFISKLIMKYFLLLQPTYFRENHLTDVIELQLTSGEARQLYETLNLSSWTINRIEYAVYKLLHDKIAKIRKLVD